MNRDLSGRARLLCSHGEDRSQVDSQFKAPEDLGVQEGLGRILGGKAAQRRSRTEEDHGLTYRLASPLGIDFMGTELM